MRPWVSHAFERKGEESPLVPEEFGSADSGPFVEAQQTKGGVPSYSLPPKSEVVLNVVALVVASLLPVDVVAAVHQSSGGANQFPQRRVVKRELSRTKRQRQF